MAAHLPALFLNHMSLVPRTGADDDGPGPSGAPPAKKAKTAGGKAQKMKLNYNSVAVLGATVGQRIRGARRSDGADVTDEGYENVADTEFEVVEGVVWPNRAHREALLQHMDRATWAKKLATFLNLKNDFVAMALIDPPWLPKDATDPRWAEYLANDQDSHSSVGVKNHNKKDHMESMTFGDQTCKLKVITLGKRWTEGGLEFREGEVYDAAELLMAVRRNFEEATANAAKKPIGQLVLRRFQWMIGEKSGKVAYDPSIPPYAEALACFGIDPVANPAAAECYEVLTGDTSPGEGRAPLGKQRLHVPASAPQPFGPDDAYALFVSSRLQPESVADQAVRQRIWAVVAQERVKAGAMKSMMQKLVRFGAPHVQLPDGEEPVESALVMAAVTLRLLSTDGDGYVPDLHMTVRGVTSACKRLAIIGVEDAWFPDDAVPSASGSSGALVGLLALAMVSARCSDYHVSTDTAARIAALAAATVASECIVPAQPKHEGVRESKAFDDAVPVNPAHMQSASRLLRALRSFDGDMRMLDTAARMVRVTSPCAAGTLPVYTDEREKRQRVMPLIHMIDQHAYRTVGHMTATMELAPGTVRSSSNALAARFRTVFDGVTGFNPRMASIGDAAFPPFAGEESGMVRSVRMAQSLLAPHVFPRQLQAQAQPQAELTAGALEHATASLELDPSIIAQAVAPLELKVATTRAENRRDLAADSTFDMASDPAAERLKVENALGDKHEWRLCVVMGMHSATPTVARPWTRHAPKKSDTGPRITATAKQKMVAEFRRLSTVHNNGKGFTFASRLLPRHRYVQWNAQTATWVVRAAEQDRPAVADIEWSWDALPTQQVPLLVARDAALRTADVRDDALAKKALYAAPLAPALRGLSAAPAGMDQHVDEGDDPLAAVVARLKESVTATALQQGLNVRSVLMRLYSTLTGSYAEVAVPVPARDGGQHPDELKPIEGDWIVYRALLALSLAVPSALQSKNPTQLTFAVRDARVLRCVERALRAAIVDSGTDEAKEANRARFRGAVDVMQARWEAAEVSSDAAVWRPMPHQHELVDKMRERDAEAVKVTQGHFLQLETGMGKTVIGALYALRYAVASGDAKTIIWATTTKLMESTFNELTARERTLRIDPSRVRRIQATDAPGRPRTPAATAFGPDPLTGQMPLVIMVPVEKLSGVQGAKVERETSTYSQQLTDALVAAAQHAVFVVDEVHLWYTNAMMSCNLLQAVSVAPKYLCMTATAWAGPQHLLAKEWFKGCVHFPVDTKTDLFTAMTGMMSGRVELFITEHDDVIHVTLSVEMQAEHNALLPEQWSKAAAVAREAAEPTLLRTAAELCCRDRVEGLIGSAKQPQPNGGVLVFAADKPAAEAMRGRLTALLETVWTEHGLPGAEAPIAVVREKRPDGAPGKVDWQTTTEWEGKGVGVVLTDARDAEGYNMQRFGAEVMGVYETNVNTRVQRRGRIKRIGQRRKDVLYTRVVPRNTILDLLDQRHASNDAATQSLASIATVFDTSAMDMSK